MSNELKNVHVYDGHLKGKFTPNKRYDIAEKNEMFQNFLSKIKDPFAIATVNIIIKDMESEKSANYQEENDMDASDILASILEKKDDDILPLLSEQLADAMQLGICDSGRVTRLLQVWLAINC